VFQVAFSHRSDTFHVSYVEGIRFCVLLARYLALERSKIHIVGEFRNMRFKDLEQENVTNVFYSNSSKPYRYYRLLFEYFFCKLQL
jgi:hypothetical protein